ncbi:type VII toxin-antitoxin system HepT family RNase toxin [Oceanobacter mangrovi]|uniref:type VII toxin-antitoxin system HepT family RNase toxin n=1 Tax=Oceanobacter mangrovi TaxID=2862510 RepID=UPI001C8EC43F|nr:DUF86 domain-containing protein [Oceanobacter mangrovi]
MDSTYLLSMKSHIAEINADLSDLSDILEARSLSRIESKASERLVQTLAEACIGIAKHRCKQLGYPAPENAYMAFERLSGKDPEAVDLNQWKQVIGLRNALVHDYLNIVPSVIENLIRQKDFKLLIDFANDGLGKLG